MNDDQVLASLQDHYAKSPTLQRVWASEEDELRRIVSGISSELADQYEVAEPLGVGGSGVVLRVHDLRLGVKRALKFPRPSPGKQELLAELLAAETDRLVELSHPYLMRVHARGTVSVGEFDSPYYVMDLYDSIDDADDYVGKAEITEDDFVQLLERVLEAVAYMHDQEKVHLDIKPANILVRRGNQPVIGDLGFCQGAPGRQRPYGNRRYRRLHPPGRPALYRGCLERSEPTSW